jgi:hypothetical protein
VLRKDKIFIKNSNYFIKISPTMKSKYYFRFFVFPPISHSSQQVRFDIAESDSASETSEPDSLILGEYKIKCVII